MISSLGYGLVVPSAKPVISCDLPAYGSYLYTEEEQIDFYFMVGKNADTLSKAYAYLTGNL